MVYKHLAYVRARAVSGIIDGNEVVEEGAMRKVLVIGAGAQGGPCASILAGEAGVEEIRLGDIDLDLAQRVAERVRGDRVQPLQLDAGNREAVVAAAQGVDVIINLTHLKFNEVIMSAALAANAHYVDTASNTEFLERWISGAPPKFHQGFVDAGRTALVGCGFAPGIANLLTRYVCDQMEHVEKIVIRVGRKSARVSDEVVSEWRPTWSPEILLEDYSEPPMMLVGGEFVQVPIFSNPETYTFPEPIGELLLSSHMHEEPYLIPGFYREKGLQHFDFKYPVDKLVGAFIKMGFASDEPIDVKGVQVVPRDVLMALVKRPGNKFLEEDEESILQSDMTGIMVVSVEGERAGERLCHTISYRFTDGSDHERQRQLFNAYGTTMVYVALPAVVGARICVNRDVESGIVSPDSLYPLSFFAALSERGVPFLFDEDVSVTPS
jgi:saccharopine dehydrogenase-like NADP-dependent oxidoreductase